MKPISLTCEKVDNESQFDDYYIIKCDPSAVAWSGFSTGPDRNRLLDYFISILNSTKSIYLFKLGEELVGYSQVGYKNGSYEIEGYSVLSKYQHKGLGKEIINMTVKEIENTNNGERITAWVSEINIPSIRCFQNNGFKIHEKAFEYRELKALGRIDKFILMFLK